jgi:hypothetical protein
MEARRRDAEADAGWPGLVEFLMLAGLESGPLERALSVLAAEDVSNVVLLRNSFADLVSSLTVGASTLIRNALSSTPAVGVSQQSGYAVEQAAKPLQVPQLPPVAFNVHVSFQKQSAAVRLALPGEDYANNPVTDVLPQLNLLAAQTLSDAYAIVGLSCNGARLALKKPLREQCVPPGSQLTAIVEKTNLVHSQASGKTNVPPPKPQQPKPALPRASDGKFKAGRAAAVPNAAPAPKPAPPAEPQTGSAATYVGQKRGPKSGGPKVDKRARPSLWTVGDGGPLGARMDKMAGKVKDDGGVPAADGKGRLIWCLACAKPRALGRPFELQNWRKHTAESAHKSAMCLRAFAPAVEEEGELEIGSERWLTVRMAQWRAMRAAHIQRRSERSE